MYLIEPITYAGNRKHWYLINVFARITATVMEKKKGDCNYEKIKLESET